MPIVGLHTLCLVGEQTGCGWEFRGTIHTDSYVGTLDFNRFLFFLSVKSRGDKYLHIKQQNKYIFLINLYKRCIPMELRKGCDVF